MKLVYNVIGTVVLIFMCFISEAQVASAVQPSDEYISGKNIEIFSGNEPDPSIVISAKFRNGTTELINLGISSKTHWLKFKVNNNTNTDELELEVPIPYLDEINLYDSIEFGVLKGQFSGELVPFSSKDNMIPYPVFNINIKQGETRTILLSVRTGEQLIVPIKVKQKSRNTFNIYFMLIGLFLGTFTAMFFYNLILFFNTRNISYLYYVLYLLAVFYTQSCVLGLSHFVFPNSPIILNASFYIATGLVGIFGPLFIYNFLGIKKDQSIIYKVTRFFYGSYGVSLLLALLGFYSICYVSLQLNGILISLFLLFVGLKSSASGNSIAKYFVFAWSLFLIGVIIFVLKDFNLIPFSKFTMVIMPLGAMIETVLLSVALAHQINILKKDNEETHQRVIEEVTKNEELILNQNITLERKVKERTSELQLALNELKSTQSQLVQSEKMASLGVLTAGIAHEINNPINFVTANVIPLRENIDEINMLLHEYKNLDTKNMEAELARIGKIETDMDLTYTVDETKQLINGIEEGARRTHHIVDGLKTFSRSDSGVTAIADINKSIESTISVLKSRLNNITLSLQLDGTLPHVECQIGKISQVVLNILNNAIDAVDEKFGSNSHESRISISSFSEEDFVKISISDNANGMSEETKKKIMEPFFTTKEIGKGTGLGLSISYSIIEDHDGELLLESTEGKGTTFTIVLPKGKATA